MRTRADTTLPSAELTLRGDEVAYLAGDKVLPLVMRPDRREEPFELRIRNETVAARRVELLERPAWLGLDGPASIEVESGKTGTIRVVYRLDGAPHPTAPPSRERVPFTRTPFVLACGPVQHEVELETVHAPSRKERIVLSLVFTLLLPMVGPLLLLILAFTARLPERRRGESDTSFLPRLREVEQRRAFRSTLLRVYCVLLAIGAVGVGAAFATGALR